MAIEITLEEFYQNDAEGAFTTEPATHKPVSANIIKGRSRYVYSDVKDYFFNREQVFINWPGMQDI